jgi:hypothetical protein
MQRFESNRLADMQERTLTQAGLRGHFMVACNGSALAKLRSGTLKASVAKVDKAAACKAVFRWFDPNRWLQILFRTEFLRSPFESGSGG